MHLNIGCNVSDELFSTDSGTSLPCLGLELYQLGPQVLGGPREIADLSICVEAKHLWGVGQREGVNVLQVLVPRT